jgi:hypothetical protein
VSLGEATEPNEAERRDFVAECHRSGHEELLFRVKQRDDWLKLQLLAQSALLALALGVELGGVKLGAPSMALPSILVLSCPVSFILTCLYVVEDRLVGLISRHVAWLSEVERGLSRARILIEYVGGSEAIREYAKTTLPIRVLAQVMAFAVMPLLIEIYRYIVQVPEGVRFWAQVLIDATCLMGVSMLLRVSYQDRKKSGQSGVPEKATPKAQATSQKP